MELENPGQCRALNVSDEKRCVEIATSVNGLFCGFHSRQCQGMVALFSRFFFPFKISALSIYPNVHLKSSERFIHKFDWSNF